MKYSTNQFKQGMKLLIEGEPCSIISYEFHKPGKGQAVMRTKLYNLRTKRVWERTFKSGESVESADIVEKDGVEIARSYHRHILQPGADVSEECDVVKAIAPDVWTADVVTAYQASIVPPETA